MTIQKNHVKPVQGPPPVDSLMEMSILDQQVIKIITELNKLRVEQQISFTDQMILKGAQQRAVHLFLTIFLALLITGAMLVQLLGTRHWVTVALNLGFMVAGVVSGIGFMVFMLISTIIRKRIEDDPLSEAKLKDRLKYDSTCAMQIIKMVPKPTVSALERAALLLKGQIERYAGYTGARNEYFRSVKDLLLAGLLIIGLSPETATGEWMSGIRWIGAATLILGIVLGQISKGRVY
jgi:hypothetical protein